MRTIPAFVLGLLVFLSPLACGDDGPTDDGDVGGDGGDDPPTVQDTWLLRFTGPDTEEMEAVIVTARGDYLVAGTTLSAGAGGGDVWLVEVSPQGAVNWQRAYGGPGLDVGYDVKETPDGGFVVAAATESFGASGSDTWVLKLDREGEVEWARSYGGAATEQVWSVDLVPDGGYVLAGGTTSFGAGGSDVLVLRLDAQGEVEWQKALGGPADEAPGGEYDEHVARVVTAPDGGYVVSSESYSFGAGGNDVWVVKLSAGGEVEWEYAYGMDDDDGTWMFQERAGGGYVVAGYFTPTTDYDTDLWLLTLRGDGTVDWQKTYGVSGIYDEALAVGTTGDGGALAGGSYYEEGDADWSLTLARVDGSGNLQWSRRYERGFDWANSMAELADGGFVVAGVTLTSLADQEDLWLMKTAPDGSIGDSCSAVRELDLAERTTSVSPVPTSATVTDVELSVRVTDPTVTETGLTAVFECSE